MVGMPMDPSMAQAEIDQFLAEQRSRKRMKTFIYVAVTLVVAGVIGFMVLQNEIKQRRVNEVYNFFTTFREVDDEEGANFWKCTVRAKHKDVRLAKDTLEITEGLSKAFNNFPKGQPDFIKDKCVPMIGGILESLDKLQPPSGFEQPLDAVKESWKEVRTVFMTYAARIGQRKQEAIQEQDVRNACNAFHTAFDQPDVEGALDYYNILACAVPDLDKKIKSVTKPPDTQPIVEYIYNTCKADPKFADKLRKECYDKRKENKEKTGAYREAVRNMSGDNRDSMAIDDCFQRANVGFDKTELEAVAKIFIKYNEARGEILKQLAKVKEETAE